MVEKIRWVIIDVEIYQPNSLRKLGSALVLSNSLNVNISSFPSAFLTKCNQQYRFKTLPNSALDTSKIIELVWEENCKAKGLKHISFESKIFISRQEHDTTADLYIHDEGQRITRFIAKKSRYVRKAAINNDKKRK